MHNYKYMQTKVSGKLKVEYIVYARPNLYSILHPYSKLTKSVLISADLQKGRIQ